MNAVLPLYADCGYDDHPPLPNSTACATCDPPDDWYDRIACKDLDIEVFFGGTVATRVARATCAVCVVRPYCLEKGWEEAHGVWAGLTDDQRDRLRRALGTDGMTRRDRRRTIRTLASRPVEVPVPSPTNRRTK